MRKWNKLLALVLAMVMVFGLTATAFATGGENKGEETKTEDTQPTESETDKEPAEGDADADKADDAAPAEGEGDADKADDAAPAEGEDKKDEATDPAEGEGDADKADDATPAEDEDKKDEPAAVTFNDVTAGQWHYEFIQKMVAAKIVEGYSDGSFKPGSPLTWGAALKMVVIFVTNEEKDPVEGGSWASGYIAYAKDNGIWEDEVDHNKNITRVEMCQLLAKALKVEASTGESAFSDTEDGYVNALVALKVIEGFDGGIFKPDDELTRAQLCKILATVPDELLKAEPAAPTEDEDKKDDAEPTEDEGKKDDAAPTEDEGKKDDTAPTEGEDKKDDTTPTGDEKDPAPAPDKAE